MVCQSQLYKRKNPIYELFIYKLFSVLLLLLLFIFYYFFISQNSLFLKKEFQKYKSIENITKVVEICDKTLWNLLGFSKKKVHYQGGELLYRLLWGGDGGWSRFNELPLNPCVLTRL